MHYKIIKIDDKGVHPKGCLVDWVKGYFCQKKNHSDAPKKPMTLKEANEYLFPQGWMVYSIEK